VPPSPRAAVALTLLAAFTVWISWRAKTLEIHLAESRGQARALIGKPAPDFRLNTLAGRSISPADFRSQHMLVVAFWASWCGPCRVELPELVRFYRQTHTLDADFELVAVSIDSDRADAERAATELQLPFPVLLDPDSATLRAYGAQGIPALYVIGKEGRVRYANVGATPALDLTLAHELRIKNYGPPGSVP
jgi:peroxiredoxin